MPLPPISTLFPYTTLFRSPRPCAAGSPGRFHRRGRRCRCCCCNRSEEHTSELQSRFDLVCRLLLEKKNDKLGGPSVFPPQPESVMGLGQVKRFLTFSTCDD